MPPLFWIVLKTFLNYTHALCISGAKTIIQSYFKSWTPEHAMSLQVRFDSVFVTTHPVPAICTGTLRGCGLKFSNLLAARFFYPHFVDETVKALWDCHPQLVRSWAEWNKLGLERQILHILPYMWELKFKNKQERKKILSVASTVTNKVL